MQQVMTRRPQIGEPGFEWQVGMWCKTRGGDMVQVTSIAAHIVAGGRHYHTLTGRYQNAYRDDRRDLIKVVAWPKEPRK